MTITEAAEILRQHNVWRRWDGDLFDQTGPQMQLPHLVGEAIDIVVGYLDLLERSA